MRSWAFRRTRPQKDIKSAYRKLARKWHPDANPEQRKRGRGEVQRDFRGLRGLRRPGEAQEVRRARAELAAGRAASRTAAPLSHERRRRRVRVRSRRRRRPERVLRFLRHVLLRRRTAPDRARPRDFARRGQDLETTIELGLARRLRRRNERRSRCKSKTSARDATAPAPKRAASARNVTAPDDVLVNKRFEVTIPKGIGDGPAHSARRSRRRRASTAAPTAISISSSSSQDDPTYKRKGDDLYVDLPVSIYDLAAWAAR